MSRAEETRPALLVLAPVYEPALKALAPDYDVHKLWEQADPAAYLRTPQPHIRGAVTAGVAGFRGEQIANLPGLEIVACFGVGHGTLDVAAARARGITVANTPDDSTENVADLAMGLMLAVMRGICESDRFVRVGTWEKKPFRMGTALNGKLCGLIGLGNIGRAIARRAEASGMKIGYFGPRRKDDVAYAFHAELVSLARAADCLVIACPERPDTRGIVNAEVLAALGSKGYLVNIGRGSVVDEPALVEALKQKTIAGAGLDVFANEPRVPQAMKELDNVVLTAHIGTSTQEIRDERSAKLRANLRAHFAGEPVPHAVT